MVCTECELGSLPDGHVVDAGTSWGYPVPRPGRRKVAMWSRHPWTAIDRVGHPNMPTGRLVAATTHTPSGPLRVVGVCVPWRGAHVSTGRRDRAPWEDHAAFLEHLPGVLATQGGRFVVAGDFNQRIPRSRQPAKLAAALSKALRGLTVPTTGDTQLGQLIDHVALGPGLVFESIDLLPGRDEQGPMSDHVGAVVTMHRD